MPYPVSCLKTTAPSVKVGCGRALSHRSVDRFLPVQSVTCLVLHIFYRNKSDAQKAVKFGRFQVIVRARLIANWFLLRSRSRPLQTNEGRLCSDFKVAQGKVRSCRAQNARPTPAGSSESHHPSFPQTGPSNCDNGLWNRQDPSDPLGSRAAPM